MTGEKSWYVKRLPLSRFDEDGEVRMVGLQK
jgi:hypothetical protein